MEANQLREAVFEALNNASENDYDDELDHPMHVADSLIEYCYDLEDQDPDTLVKYVNEYKTLKEAVFTFLRNAKEEGYDFFESAEQIACDIHNADDSIPVDVSYKLLIPFVETFKVNNSPYGFFCLLT